MTSKMRLPPLNAIRTFEAAGRHGNFTRAAAELNVTPGAVSRQIRALETHLGLSLFVRTHTDVRITRHGQLYLQSVQEALSRLEGSTQEIIVQTTAQPLRLWGSRYFIQLWLMPRLQSYLDDHPDQEIEITSLLSSGEPMPPESDIGIRFGEGAWPGLRSHFLIGRHLTPVCSPEYLANSPTLERPEDLEQHSLLHNVVGYEDWRRWYEASGAAPAALKRRVVCTSADVAYAGALEGLGVTLGRRGFIERDLEAGRLVNPIPFTYHAEGSFYLTYHDREHLPGRLLQFRRWILKEIQSSFVR